MIKKDQYKIGFFYILNGHAYKISDIVKSV